MFEEFFIEFEEPGWLVLAVLVLPAYMLARRSIGGLSPLKTHVTFAIRAVVILLLAMALAKPTWLEKGEGLTVVTIVDRSRSVPVDLQQQTLEYLRTASQVGRRPEDRLGVITVGDGARISALPNRYASFDNFADNLADHDATNLAEGVRLALATAPQDTMIRFVIATDGNETDGHVLEAAKVAQANGIPIDVLPLRYEHGREVIFDRVIAPARARRGQVTSLRLTMRAQSATSGTLTLLQNGVPLDLDPDSPETSVHVELQQGLNTKTIPVLFDEAGPQQFEARFVADDPQSDPVAENNSAVGVTFVGGEGRVLIVSDSPSESEALAAALQASDLSVEIQPPSHISNIVTLGGYDAVILMNQARGAYTAEMDKWLHDYVHDLGGGLVMVGGPNSFGAGGWIDSEVEKALPLKLDPPQNLQRQRGALALIMHSCEMPQGNHWGIVVAQDAIKALSSLDYVGILDYNWQAGGATWEWGPALAGDKSGPLAAAQAMPIGDMPDFASAMQLAFDGMKNLNANKHAIIISDGDPSPPSQALLNKYVAAKFSVTTVMVAGHGTPQHLNNMQQIANITGGRFYNVTNPKNLPQIFIEEARVVARSLIVEDQVYTPRMRNPMAEPIRGFDQVPAVDGYVLTAPKEGLAEIPYVSDPHGDPIYANWNYGIGKAIAFTPDLSGTWGARWIAWDDFKGFWDQSVRWAMRPASPSNLTVMSRLEGDRAIVEVEAYDADESFLNNLSTSSAVLGPEGTEPLSLHQVGPGRYRGEFQVDDAGAYLVNMHFTQGGESMGNLQAAVNVPYAREYRTVKDDFAKVTQLQESTGGRILSDRPELAQLWDRTGLEVRRSHKPIWDLLAIIAATIFLFDVAARRLSIGPAEVRNTMRKVFGKRGEVGEDTMAAWKKARSQVAHRRTPAGDSKSGKGAEADRTAKFEAGEDAPAIDVGAESAEAPQEKTDQPRRRPVKEQPPEDEGDFTSRLLAAKRRARSGGQGQQSDDDGGGGNG